ncbi:MAG TPA: SDR family oxidoreductase [Ignavibacteria bacterium]|nr:NAD-dependent epimerase [Bacteroidota bacterium]HRI84502.1 SDR family oxidoreductase [Ignavibacteria bacterium]HRK00570.1 SDR family oxidoreductase [Ignavibacteria bacterium]
MATLIFGASGETGKLLTEQLLASGRKVKIIVRPVSNIPENWSRNENLTIIKRSITEISSDELAGYISNCQTAACCLGHNLTLKGVFGKPKRLVTDSVKLICEAIQKNSPSVPVRFVLMNTAGNSNRDLNEPVSFGQKIVIGLLRLFLPPHTDNEMAADYLRENIGQKNPCIEWAVVRPDNLTNEERVSEYSINKSPTRSAIFNAGKTSRINVAHFMAALITDDELWKKWKGQMPVIYNV